MMFLVEQSRPGGIARLHCRVRGPAGHGPNGTPGSPSGVTVVFSLIGQRFWRLL